MPRSTPIWIRGKRSATTAEKWHHGKQRKSIWCQSPSERSSSVASSASDCEVQRRQRWKQQSEQHLSKLEQLPTEILHSIFEYSANVDLPLVSPRLASQLASRHLYHQLTSRILGPHSEQILKDKLRLTNSVFFTWQFFLSWLRAELSESPMLRDLRKQNDAMNIITTQEREDGLAMSVWKSKQHGGLFKLLPPTKLFLGPFTTQNVKLLRCLTPDIPGNLDYVDPLYRELARGGLERAVAEGAFGAFLPFWNLGLLPDTELLRLAVMDAGCDKDVIFRLLRGIDTQHVDFLDTSLWSWADKARMKGDEKGTWLIELLKESARGRIHKDAEIKTEIGPDEMEAQ